MSNIGMLASRPYFVRESSTEELERDEQAPQFYQGQIIYVDYLGAVKIMAVSLPKTWWRSQRPRYAVMLFRGFLKYQPGKTKLKWYPEKVLVEGVANHSHQRDIKWRQQLVFAGLDLFFAEDTHEIWNYNSVRPDNDVDVTEWYCDDVHYLFTPY